MLRGHRTEAAFSPRWARFALYGGAVLVVILLANLIAVTIFLWGRHEEAGFAWILIALWLLAAFALMLIWRGFRRLLDRMRSDDGPGFDRE